MATLHGAITLVKVHDIALLVAENLHFNVLGTFDVAFEKDGRVTKGALCFTLRFFE